MMYHINQIIIYHLSLYCHLYGILKEVIVKILVDVEEQLHKDISHVKLKVEFKNNFCLFKLRN